MKIPPTAIRPDSEGGSLLDCRIQPGASRSRVAGDYGGRLKIAVAAPPVDGRANAALGRYLAALLKIPAGRVRLLSGEGSRDKRVRLVGVTPEALLGALEEQT